MARVAVTGGSGKLGRVVVTDVSAHGTTTLGKAVEEEMARHFCRWDPQASMVGQRFSNVMESAGYAAFPSYEADPPGIPGSTASLSRMLRRCQTPGPHLQPPRAATRREASTVALQDHERDGGSSGSRRPFLCVVPDGRDHRGRIPGFGTSAAGMIVTSPA